MYLEIGVATPTVEGFEGSHPSARKGARNHFPAEIRIQQASGFQAAPACFLRACDLGSFFHNTFQPNCKAYSPAERTGLTVTI